MTAPKPRPPAMRRGRYWYVRAYVHALKGIVASVIASACYICSRGIPVVGLGYDQQYTYPRSHHVRAEAFHDYFLSHPGFGPRPDLSEAYPLLADMWRQPLYEAFPAFLGRTLTYEPIVAAIGGMLCCTVLLHQIEKWRRKREVGR